MSNDMYNKFIPCKQWNIISDDAKIDSKIGWETKTQEKLHLGTKKFIFKIGESKLLFF